MRTPVFRILGLAMALAATIDCGRGNYTSTYVRPDPLIARPDFLAFTCVSPGCESTQAVRVFVAGTRKVAIKRILLSDEAQTDFSLEFAEDPPFVAAGGSDFEVKVHYAPTGAPSSGTVQLLVSYTDASPQDAPDRVLPGELKVPLLRRLVGEPQLVATPSNLSFGAVAVGSDRSLKTRVVNAGFGNVPVELSAFDAGTSDLTISIPRMDVLVPDAGVDLSVRFVPRDQRYVRAEVVVAATAEDVHPARITVEGTSIQGPRIGLWPSGDIEFGDLPLKQRRVVTRELVNQGGSALQVTSISVLDPTGNVKASLHGGQSAMTLMPLERKMISIELEGKVAGEVAAQVALNSNDPMNSTLTLIARALVTEPKLTLTPPALDFGTVPVGWVMAKPIELRNTGYGDLTVKHIRLGGGTSELFSLRQLPSVPFVLERQQRVALEVEFRAETSASFAGFISVETDEPGKNFSEVTLKAVAGSCTASCLIANGTPTCAHGTCEVGSCKPGYFDTDHLPATGCECKEVGVDPGSFCSTANYSGVLKDSEKTKVNFSGVLPADGDVDIVRFFASDGFDIFGDNFDVRVSLASSDPNIKLCVYRYPTGSHKEECFFSNETCPDTNEFRKGGGGGDDSADFMLKVYRTPGAPLTCATYTLFLSNG